MLMSPSQPLTFLNTETRGNREGGDWDALTHGVEGRTQGGLMRWVGQAFFNSNISLFYFSGWQCLSLTLLLVTI